MTTFVLVFVLGCFCNLMVFLWAYRRKHLLWPTGVLAAAFIGMSFFLITPFAWIMLLTFFGSASILTKIKSHQKLEVQEKFQKGGERDAGQVFANGLPALLFLIMYFIDQDFEILWIPKLNIWILGFLACLATVNADTWATEIGLLTPAEPRWILNLSKRVPKGTSGGISFKGTSATIGGAILVGGIAFILIGIAHDFTLNLVLGVFGVIAFGTVGSLIDSFEGATIQGFFYCPVCNYETEKKIHLKCGGTKTQLLRGLNIIDNDFVNGTSAALAAFLLLILVSKFEMDFILPSLCLVFLISIIMLIFSLRDKK